MMEYVIVFLVLIPILFLYSHLYLHFLVNPNNTCSIVDNITKEGISEQVYTKQPFLVDATTFPKEIPCIHSLEESVAYDPHPLLEPYVKFYPCRKIFRCPIKKKWIETNDACRTFYRVCKGSFHVTCIHPHLQDLPLKPTKKWKKREELIQLTLHEDSLLFLPKDWSIFVEALEEATLEKIQYYSPLNYVANAISKILKYIGDGITICSTKEPHSI